MGQRVFGLVEKPAFQKKWRWNDRISEGADHDASVCTRLAVPSSMHVGLGSAAGFMHSSHLCLVSIAKGLCRFGVAGGPS